MRFSENKDLRPVHTLRIYEQKTLQYREPDNLRSHYLCLSPLRNRINQLLLPLFLLLEAGVHIEVFKGHSVRAASASAAKAKGVSLQDIMAAAGYVVSCLHLREVL